MSISVRMGACLDMCGLGKTSIDDCVHPCNTCMCRRGVNWAHVTQCTLGNSSVPGMTLSRPNQSSHHHVCLPQPPGEQVGYSPCTLSSARVCPPLVCSA